MSAGATTYLMQDGNPLAGATRELLGGVTTLVDAAGERVPDSLGPDDLLVLLADARAVHWMREMQRQAAARGASSFVIALEPGFVWFGPYRRATDAGCFGCFQSWMHNNLRRPEHWSSLTRPEERLARVSQAPLAPPALQSFGEMLTAFVENGTDAASRFSLSRSVARLRTDTLESSRHNFIPNPSCRDCSALPPDSASGARVQLQPRLKRQARDHRAPNPRLTVDLLRDRFVDRRSGLVRHVFHEMNSNLMPLYGAEMPIMGSTTTEVGYGRTETRRRSEMVAILEILERFAGHAPRRTRTSTRASYAAVRDHAVNPDDFIQHHPDQAREPGFALAPYSEHLEFDWCWAHSFRRDASVLIPQQLAYYWLPNPAESPTNRFLYDSSSGCALGGSIEEAILYGLLEVVERDAYLTTWYGRFTPVEIDLATVTDERTQSLVARSDAQGFELHVFDVRLDIDVPVVLSMIVDPQPDAPVKSYCAAAANFDPEQAIFSALVEVVTSMGVYRRSLPPQRVRAQEMFADAGNVQRMPDHVLLYSLPETFDRLRFLLSDRPKTPLCDAYAGLSAAPRNTDLTADLRSFVEKVLAVAKDVLVVDQSFSALRDAGLSCAKVLAPGLMPVTFGHQHRRVSVDRVNQASRALGLGKTFAAADLNPFPHNFP